MHCFCVISRVFVAPLLGAPCHHWSLPLLFIVSIVRRLPLSISCRQKSNASTTDMSPRTEFMQVAPTTSNVREEFSVQGVSLQDFKILRRSPRLKRMVDLSSLVSLDCCPEWITYSYEGEQIVEPRVLISRNALELWREGVDFAFVSRSLLRCDDINRIAPAPEVCF